MTATLYTVKEVAAILRCHTDTVYRMIQAGRLKAFTLGGGSYRISQESLDALAQAERAN